MDITYLPETRWQILVTKDLLLCMSIQIGVIIRSSHNSPKKLWRPLNEMMTKHSPRLDDVRRRHLYILYFKIRNSGNAWRLFSREFNKNKGITDEIVNKLLIFCSSQFVKLRSVSHSQNRIFSYLYFRILYNILDVTMFDLLMSYKNTFSTSNISLFRGKIINNEFDAL